MTMEYARNYYENNLKKGKLSEGGSFHHMVELWPRDMEAFINGWFSHGKNPAVLGRVRMNYHEKPHYCIGQNWTVRDVQLLQGVGFKFDQSAHNYEKLMFGIFQEIGS